MEGPKRGRVIDHTDAVTLRDCRAIVRESTRQRVIRDKCREVHAWIEGTLTYTEAPPVGAPCLTYNPYRAGHFHVGGDVSRAIETAARVWFARDRKAYYQE